MFLRIYAVRLRHFCLPPLHHAGGKEKEQTVQGFWFFLIENLTSKKSQRKPSEQVASHQPATSPSPPLLKVNLFTSILLCWLSEASSWLSRGGRRRAVWSGRRRRNPAWFVFIGGWIQHFTLTVPTIQNFKSGKRTIRSSSRGRSTWLCQFRTGTIVRPHEAGRSRQQEIAWNLSNGTLQAFAYDTIERVYLF